MSFYRRLFYKHPWSMALTALLILVFYLFFYHVIYALVAHSTPELVLCRVPLLLFQIVYLIESICILVKKLPEYPKEVFFFCIAFNLLMLAADILFVKKYYPILYELWHFGFWG